MPHRRSHPFFTLTNLAILLGALAPRTGATPLSLNDFEPVSLASLPVACSVAYTSPISDCDLSDFRFDGTCSAACVAGVQEVQDNVRDACDGVRARKGSMLGRALKGKLVEELCPRNSDDGGQRTTATATTPRPVITTIRPSTTAVASPTGGRGTTTAKASTTTTTKASTTITSVTTDITSIETLLPPPAATTGTGTGAGTTEAPTQTPSSDDGNNKDDDGGDNSGGGTVLDLTPDTAAAMGLAVGRASRVAIAVAVVAWWWGW